MTFKVVKFHTTKGQGNGVYEVAFNGDDRYFQKAVVYLTADLGPDVLDYVELYGIWLFMMELEMGGSRRTAKNLQMVVSRGAIKRLLRETSSKSHLFTYTNAIRTQFFGLTDIEVEKDTDWTKSAPPTFCIRWDGQPPEYPAVDNPLVGRVGVTYHSVERYYQHTNCEGRTDLVFQKVCRILREADREIVLPAKVQKHKSIAYGDDGQNARHLIAPSGWQTVVVFPANEQPLLLTVYQRNEF